MSVHAGEHSSLFGFFVPPFLQLEIELLLLLKLLSSELWASVVLVDHGDHPAMHIGHQTTGGVRIRGKPTRQVRNASGSPVARNRDGLVDPLAVLPNLWLLVAWCVCNVRLWRVERLDPQAVAPLVSACYVEQPDQASLVDAEAARMRRHLTSELLDKVQVAHKGSPLAHHHSGIWYPRPEVRLFPLLARATHVTLAPTRKLDGLGVFTDRQNPVEVQ